jgi:protoheme IX farnesyltransferase
MVVRENVNRPVSDGFRYILLAISVLTFFLIVAGVILRLTGQSSACPGWPACGGDWLPPLGSAALIPYLHRLAAFLSGMFLFGATLAAWRRYRKLPWITRPVSAAFLTLVVQAWVGGLVAELDGPAGLVGLHLGLALVVQALVLVATAAAFHGAGQSGSLAYRSPFARLSLASLAATFTLLASGALVSASGAGASCPAWPMCSDALLPGSSLGWLNLAHRLVTVLAGGLVAITFVQAWRTQRSQPAILVTATASAVLFGAQALMGAVETARGFPPVLTGLHVFTAAAVWSSLVLQVSLVGLAARSGAAEKAEAAGLKGRAPLSLGRDLLMLTKPVVVALLLVTTFAGMVIAGEAWPPLGLVFWTLLGGAMAAGGSGAINQYIDRFDDEKMQRTSRRPIPSGRLTPGEGLAFGVGLALASFYLMVVYVNFLAALLVLGGIVYYVLLYSILLKKATVQNIVIGGGAGAIPPLVGWAAVDGGLNIPALFLFAVIFMWTPPHFWALALVRRNDYARAGVPMLPVVRGESETRWQIFLYTAELVALTLVLPLFGLGGGIYLVSAAALGGALLFSAWRVWRGQGNKVAWAMYRHSSMYLAFLFLALMVDALL